MENVKMAVFQKNTHGTQLCYSDAPKAAKRVPTILNAALLFAIGGSLAKMDYLALNASLKTWAGDLMVNSQLTELITMGTMNPQIAGGLLQNNKPTTGELQITLLLMVLLYLFQSGLIKCPSNGRSCGKGFLNWVGV